MEWQRYCLARMLELTPAGDYQWRRAAVVVGRGNGKTALIAARVLHALVNRGQSVLGMAQRLEVARETWELVAETIEADPHLRQRVRRHLRGKGDARLELQHPSGRTATYRISATDKGARGPRAQLLIVDEAAKVDPAAYRAARGVQQGTGTAGGQQTVLVSSAGDDFSDVLNAYRLAALEGSDPQLLWLHYGLPDDADWQDESLWPAVVPALGHRTPLAELRAARHDLPPAVFRTEILSQWVDVIAEPVIPESVWEAARATPAELPAEPVAIGFDATPDQTRGAIVAVGRSPAGQLIAGVVAERAGIEWMPAELARLRRRYSVPIIGDALGPAAVVVDLVKRRRVKVDTLTGSDFAVACSTFLYQLEAGELAIVPHGSLEAARRLAVRRVTDRGGWTWNRGRSPGDIHTLIALTLASYAGRKPAASRPAVVVSAGAG